MKIGEVAERTGASVRALRYYEEQGLLSPGRTTTGQRVYDAHDLERVSMLRQLFAAGLSGAVIATVLPCVDSPSEQVTADTVATLREQHARIGRQIGELVATREQLAFLIDRATGHLESYRVPA